MSQMTFWHDPMYMSSVLFFNKKLLHSKIADKHAGENQWAFSDTQLETILSSTDFGPPQDLETDSNSFSISGAHLMNARFQKLYLGFWINKKTTSLEVIW